MGAAADDVVAAVAAATVVSLYRAVSTTAAAAAAAACGGYSCCCRCCCCGCGQQDACYNPSTLECDQRTGLSQEELQRLNFSDLYYPLPSPTLQHVSTVHRSDVC